MIDTYPQNRAQALSFVEDLKFGHYMKIPPRTMFMAQVVATTFSCFIQVFVLNFALKNIKDVCEITQEERFTCPGGRVFFSGKEGPLVFPRLPQPCPHGLSCCPSIQHSPLTHLSFLDHSLCDLGPDRSSPYILTGSSLLRSLPLLCPRLHSPHRDPLLQQAQPNLTRTLPDRTANLWRRGSHPPRNTTELPLLGRRGLRVPVRHQEALLQVVEPSELLDLLGAGSGFGSRDTRHVLRVHHDRDRSAKVVGQYGRERDNGLSGHCGADESWRRADFWTGDVVNGGKSEIEPQ